MRNAEFDRQAVLRSAMQVFTQYGYAKTSMQKLTQATGLHPGSIYCAFGNKKGLLLAAIAQYQADRKETFSAFFGPEKSVINGLENYLKALVSECSLKDSNKVCLLTRTLTEIDGQDSEVCQILSSGLREYETLLTGLFSRAIAGEELSADTAPDELARFFVMGIYGIRTYAYTQPKREVLDALAGQLINALFDNNKNHQK